MHMILFLVEGVTDKIFYEMLLKKLLGLDRLVFTQLPNELREFIGVVRGIKRR